MRTGIWAKMKSIYSKYVYRLTEKFVTNPSNNETMHIDTSVAERQEAMPYAVISSDRRIRGLTCSGLLFIFFFNSIF